MQLLSLCQNLLTVHFSDMMETSSPAHSGETVSDTEEFSTKCTSCKVLHKILLDIVKK